MLLIKNGIIINEGQRIKADLVVDGDRIKEIIPYNTHSAVELPPAGGIEGGCIDASGCYVIPGVIDSHVHFREPGLTHKADMETESRAAAWGGVTTVFDMPNTLPQTTTLEALREKQAMARGRMHVNYTFFPGATNDNLDELRKMDVHEIPGIKLFMGSSTGNMLVDREEALDGIFALAKEMDLPLMAHCEDTDIINRNMARVKEELGMDDPPIQYHPYIRSEEACYCSSLLGVKLAKKHGTRFHIAHITTARELSLLGGNVTGEATVAHLLFSREDYDTLGSLIKCNPAVKTLNDRDALRNSLTSHLSPLTSIGTDHAPHTWEEKQGGCARAMSGMPMVQFSLVSMLGLVDKEVLTLERLVELMSHNPARLFGVSERGFLRPGYKADIAIIRRGVQGKCNGSDRGVIGTIPEAPDGAWKVTKEIIQSKCGWSPLEGKTFNWRVEHTIVNGQIAYSNSLTSHLTPLTSKHGEAIKFRI